MDADWYPDPSDPNRQRFWDGVNWTRHVYGPQGQDTDDFVPAGPPPGVSPELWASAPPEVTGGTFVPDQPVDADPGAVAGYGAPGGGYGYGAPGGGYGAPGGGGYGYGAPGGGGSGYGVPGGGYGAPAGGYGAPAGGGSGYGYGYGVPPGAGYGGQYGYGAPGAGGGYGAPGASGAPGYGQPGPAAPYGYSSPYASQPAYGSPSPYGSPYVSPYAAPGFTPIQGNGLATASLVLGLCGAIIEWGGVLTLAAAVLAIIFGVVGMKRARAMAGQYGAGRGRAIAGLILGCVALAAYLAWGLASSWAFLLV